MVMLKCAIMIRSLFFVMLGGALGSGLRHLVNVGSTRLFGISFPWGTLSVNLIGSFIMGLLIGWLSLKYEGGGQGLRLFLATGILGGFTTFSAFSLDAVMLWQRGEFLLAMGYVAGSVVFSLALLVVGLALGRGFA